MADLIALVILIFSFFAAAVIIFRKIPVLAKLPGIELKKEENLFLKLKKRAEKVSPFKNFSYELSLQKILAKIRILALKIENFTLNWVQRLKESYQEKKALKFHNYWRKIKKEVKEKEVIKKEIKRKEIKKVAKPK